MPGARSRVACHTSVVVMIRLATLTMVDMGAGRTSDMSVKMSRLILTPSSMYVPGDVEAINGFTGAKRKLRKDGGEGGRGEGGRVGGGIERRG